MKITFECKSPDELAEAAEILVNYFRSARIFAFSGEMGAGKTSFIKAICRELGSTDMVNSPTYTLVNEYNIHKGQRIYHFDFYRIKDISEAIQIGFDEYLESGNYCFIEWPENVSELLPHDTVYVQMSHKGQGRLIGMSEKKIC